MKRQTDILLFGPDSGLAAFAGMLHEKAPGLTIAGEECESDESPETMRRELLNAVAMHNPASVLLASHALSLYMPEIGADECPVLVHRTAAPLAEAARLSCTRNVALLARPETLSHPASQRQIALYQGRGLKITPLPCESLASMTYRYHGEGLLPDILALRELMAPVRDNPRIDTIIIASAHAALMRRLLEKAAFRPVYWVDGAAVSVARFLAQRHDSLFRSESKNILQQD